MAKKVAFVTGASQGIGRAVSLALAEDGYHVILSARNQEKLEALQQEIKQQGGEVTVISLDVSKADQVKSVVGQIVKSFGRIDVLFNNAGMLRLGSIDVPDDEMLLQVEINLLGAMYVAKYVALQMKQQKSGYIMNVSSMSGQRGFPGIGCYTATKFGLVGFTESLHKELIGDGIKVTSICPSFTATDMVKFSSFPLEKMIRPNDIVKTVRYLLELGDTAIVANINIECSGFVAMQHSS